MTNWSFEQLLTTFLELKAPHVDEAREVEWLGGGTIGVGRDTAQRFEVFLRSEKPLVTNSQLVKRHLKFDTWKGAGGATFEASYFVLPASPHFAAVASLIAEELLRHGADTRPLPEVFREVEPIIEMALRRSAMAEEEMIGLIGELQFLEQMLFIGGEAQAEKVLGYWRGFEKGSRDFVLGARAIEVKTTQTKGSTHRIHSLRQVEPDPGSEDEIYLLSVGLRRADTGVSLPDTVEKVLARLPEQLHVRCLESVRNYGTDVVKYEHAEMKTWGIYQTKYTPTFAPRLYNMNDEEMNVLKSDHVAGMFLKASSVQYTIELPEKVTATNPARNLEAFLKQILQSVG